MCRLLFCIVLSISVLSLHCAPGRGQQRAVRRAVRLPSNVPALARKACLPAHITAGKTTLCPSETGELRSNILPEYRYRWFRDGTLIPTETAYLLLIDAPGTYRLEVTNTAFPGCVQTDELAIGESTLRAVSLVPISSTATGAVSGTVACTGGSLVAALSSTAPPDPARLTYQWQRNGFLVPATSPVLFTPAPGQYTVAVSDGDCVVEADPVVVFGTPAPVFRPPPDVCERAEAVELLALPTGGIFSGKGIRGVVFDPLAAGGGVHTLIYSLTSTAGCAAQTSQPVRVVSVPQPDLGPNQTIISGTRITLQGPPGPNLTYTWEPIAGLTLLQTNPDLDRLNAARVVAQPTETTTYRLTVSANSQCPLSSSLTITVLPGLFFPTAFTPNGDGLNDTWALTGIEAFPAYAVQIYNRWGELILDQLPYSQPWDGRIRGEPVAPGPYRFVIRPAPFLPERAGTLLVLE